MFLVDTNVWLERLLDQERADEAGRFLAAVEASDLLITDFSLYSIGIMLCRLGKEEVFEDFVSDTLLDSGVSRFRLDAEDMRQLLAARRQFGLDFDDAYQYVAATKTDAIIVSFDDDFERTDLGKKTPAEVLAQVQNPPGQPG